MKKKRKIHHLLRIFSFLIFYICFSSSYSPQFVWAQSVFDVKYEDALSDIKKGDLVSAYVKLSIAYDYAEKEREKYLVKVHLGDILFEWGDTFAAEKLYQEASLIEKTEEIIRKIVIVKAENLSDDFPEYIKLIPEDKIDSELLYHWGRYVLRKQGETRRACDIFDSIRRESEFFQKAQYMCGIAMIMLGDRDEALRRFEMAKDGTDPLLQQYSWLAIARIYSDMGRFNDALPYYLKIPAESPVFYEAKYEVCWVFYALEKYDDVRRCIDYFKTAKKTYLSRRIDVLDAFLSMKDDIVRSYLTFTMISDSSAMLLSRIIEVEKAPLSFWKSDYKRYFAVKEPSILGWVEMFPEYRFFKERRDYIAGVQGEIKKVLADLERIRSSSVLVADRSIKKYLERVWLIQDRIYNMVSDMSYNITSSDEKNIWYTLYSLFQELKNMDFKSRELVAIASLKSNEIAKEKEFKGWEKKYEAYRKSMELVMKEIDKIVDFYKQNSQLVVRMAQILSRDAKDTTPLEDMIKTYENSFKIFLDFSSIWNEIIAAVSKYLEVQQKKLLGMNNMLENFLSYLDEFEISLMKYVFTVKIKKEVEKTYALAQYGFIETAWTMKERESDVLNQLHAIRLDEENKVRDNLNEMYDYVKKISIEKVEGEGVSFFGSDVSESEKRADEIERKLDESLKFMMRVSNFSWNPPSETIQKLIEKRQKEKEELERKMKEINK